ncbi:hypothetical protein HZI73_06760 [Vallitalea pronyensis]|uniref:Uncharacterized protein n=1 Tax=Vallitalea pronyensis TaxID=1348613 RepID=A0A8J8MI09_9FIRM|nr:hypothetical protein [Vallitalea pronyensis]QUI22020.1 hypothetical protein HZI73_06760 [Vallitalea pronyensis]
MNKVSQLISIFEDIIAIIDVEYHIEILTDKTLMIHVTDEQKSSIYYAIANVDNKLEHIPIKHIPLCRFITLGLNKKSSVTISSLEADSDTNQTMIYCIQREIGEGDGLIEPQEFPVFIKASWGRDVYNIMSAVTAAMLINRQIHDKLNSIKEG